MFVTIISGHVTEENWRTLGKSYERAIRIGAEGILTSMLIQSQTEPKMWEIITTWHSEEDYKTAHEQKIANTCVGRFCNAGSTPQRAEYNVLGHYTRV